MFCPPALFYCPEYERAKKPAAEVAAVAANRLSRSSTVGGSPHRMEANAAGVSTHSGRNEAWTDHYSDWASTSASALADVGDALSLRASDPLGASRQSAGGRLSDTRGSAQSVDDVKEVCVWQFLQETTVDRLQGLMLKVGAMQRSHPRGQFTPATQAQLHLVSLGLSTAGFATETGIPIPASDYSDADKVNGQAATCMKNSKSKAP